MMIALDALPAGVYTVKVEEMNYWASPMKLVVVH
jgi:hypothetical protein